MMMMAGEPVSVQASRRPGSLRRGADAKPPWPPPAQLRGAAKINLLCWYEAPLGFELIDCGSLPFGGFTRIDLQRAVAWLATGLDGPHKLGDLTPCIRSAFLAALVEIDRPLHRDGRCPRAMVLNEVNGRAGELGAVQ
jgi:hypothetical protein